jgi:hypothetical protein
MAAALADQQLDDVHVASGPHQRCAEEAVEVPPSDPVAQGDPMPAPRMVDRQTADPIVPIGDDEQSHPRGSEAPRGGEHEVGVVNGFGSMACSERSRQATISDALNSSTGRRSAAITCGIVSGRADAG